MAYPYALSRAEIMVLLEYILGEISNAAKLSDNETVQRILADTEFQTRRLMKSLEDDNEDRGT